ncbi:hypothetical protein PYW07_008019 [Mythimna separata]|uniref:Uncharacterized protein n=1 Tax=Mythimna separata TaxID=271217 RepID=A0AAD8DUG8_MYTSE|nr:hypothetical protein PYW07_008019 [Mythimna separata]
MHSIVFLMLVALSSCLALYRGSYESRNYITREEPVAVDGYKVLVECPVCEHTDHWMASNVEECPIRKGNKTYKICKFGTYINEVCGKRLDCFRGPLEQCTEKREFDMYGKKCAPGYYCNKLAGVCTGPDVSDRLDSIRQWQLIPFTGRRSELKEDDKFSFDGLRN